MLRNFQLRAQFNRKKPSTLTGGGKSDVKDKTGKDVDAVEAPPIVLEFEKIETTEKNSTTGNFENKSDDDFAPLLDEKAHIYVKITNLPNGVNGKLKIDIGRKTKTAVAIVAEVAKEVTGTDNPITEKVVWDGKATKDVPRQFSDRQTKDHNSGNNVNIPMDKIDKGKEVPHGLYLVKDILLFDKKDRQVAQESPSKKGMSVPAIVNLTFNSDWSDDLKAFGLEPFSDKLKEALRRFGGRNFMVNQAAADRINARFAIDAGTTNSRSMVVSLGGINGQDIGGAPFLYLGKSSAWKAINPWYDNIFAALTGLGNDIKLYARGYMYYNTAGTDTDDRNEFIRAFKPMGVESTASHNAPGTATARAVDGSGKVTGACDAIDADNTTLTIDANGKADVKSIATDKVPEERARAIQLAFNHFVKILGLVISHEIGHSFGVVSERKAKNRFRIDTTSIAESPLNGDSGAHNRVTNDTNIMDPGPGFGFKRMVEGFKQQKFHADNAMYMRKCVPYDPKDD